MKDKAALQTENGNLRRENELLHELVGFLSNSDGGLEPSAGPC